MRYWHQKLSFRLTLVLLAVFGLLLVMSVGMIYIVQRSLLVRQGQDSVEHVGLRVVSDLNGLILQAQNQTRVMADLAQVVKPDADEYQKLFGHIIIPPDMSNVVAGGGIWPEPFAFDPKVERRSFFWGVEPNGTLKFYDDYNNPQSPGYHNEHWYFPARYYPPAAAIWSRSYTDPYSLQPMVTCTVPVYKNNTFAGAATIDLKLDGLNQILVAASQSTGGYMFVVDRESRFVAFPRMNMVRSEQPDAEGLLQTNYLQLDDVATQMPGMGRIEEMHDEMNIRMIQNAQQNMANFSQRVNELHRQNPSLSREETQLLIAAMFDQTQLKAVNPKRVRRMNLPQMPLVDGPCMVSVFHMPRTYWNVVLVVPESTFTRPADQASARLAMWLAGLEVLTLGILFFAVYKWVFHPSRCQQVTELTLQWGDQNHADLEENMQSLASSMENIRKLVRPQLPSNQQIKGLMCVTTDIPRLIDDLLKVDRQQIIDQQIQLRVDVTVKDLLRLDAYRLAQALTNILGNARHALEKVEADRRRLNVTAHLIDETILQITIHDTGCGIDPQQLPNIFDNGYTTRPAARGVGLHSAALAIRELGGSINAHSDGKNKGSTFTLSVPVEIQQAPSLAVANR